MYIRLISGLLKNHKISAPNSRKTHPMSERARNAIFNRIQSDIVNADVLDAFAGTGALGLEALSRGAKSATFLEKDRKAQKVLAENLELLDKNNKLGEGRLIRSSISSWLNSSQAQLDLGELDELPEYDIIFADPPYYDPQFPTVERLCSRLKSGGMLILSQPKEIDIFYMSGLDLLSEKEYSGAKIMFFSKD